MHSKSLSVHEVLMVKTGNTAFRFFTLVSSTERGSLLHIILFTCLTSRNRTGSDLDSLLITLSPNPFSHNALNYVTLLPKKHRLSAMRLEVKEKSCRNVTRHCELTDAKYKRRNISAALTTHHTPILTTQIGNSPINIVFSANKSTDVN
jgi:hypothetical protein